MSGATLMWGRVSAARDAAWMPSVVALGAVVLAFWYTFFYLQYPETPGNAFLAGGHGLGWMAWYDQGKTYDSALGLAVRNFDPRAHWYPLGYAMLAAPFILRLHGHAFFFVDLACLLLAYWGFVSFARRVGVAALWAAPLFLLVFADPWLFRQWVIPWSSTPSAALAWLLLATAAAHMQGTRRPFLLGLLAAPLPLMRPMDVLIAVPCLLWAGWTDLRFRRMRLVDVGLVILGAAIVVLPYAVVYRRIYGLHASPYMIMSRQLGFTIHRPIWRAYTLFIEPREWFLQGDGLLQRCPWLILGLGGVLLAWRDRALALLAFCLMVYCAVYLSYIDLLPSGLWRFNNVHYFKWAMPGFGLLGLLLLRELLAAGNRRRVAAAFALVAVVAVTAIHVAPRPVPADGSEPAVVVDIIGEHTNDENAYFGPLMIQDGLSPMTNINDMRVLPTPTGLRLIGLRRDFVGPVRWLADHSPAGPLIPHQMERYGTRIEFGYPCWLPPYACKPVDFQERDDPLTHRAQPVTSSLPALEGK